MLLSGLVSMAGCGVKGPPVPYVTQDEAEATPEKSLNVDVKNNSDKAMVPSSKIPIGKPQGLEDKKGKGRL